MLRKHRALVLFLVGMSGCLCAFIVTQQIKGPIEIERIPPPTQITELKLKPQIRPSKNDRYVYPYSVIPGGVISREELIDRIDSDPVVAKHYAGFNTGRAEIVKAEQTQFMYVAYRLHDKLYWTTRKLKIPQGETLISDGNDFARTRCGNRVSATPMEPVAQNEEPAVEIFETPMLARLEEPELPGIAEHGLETVDIPPMQHVVRPAPKILPYYYRPLFSMRTDYVVPEPATFGLMAVGLVALISIRIARRK